MPEIHLSPCVDEVYGEWEDRYPEWYQVGGRGEVECQHWMRRVIDASGGQPPHEVPIYWSVRADGLTETAPLGHLWGNRHVDLGDFLTHFSHPVDCRSGDYINFLRLPIEHRFPDFASALGWQPSALAPTCPFFALYQNDNRPPRRA